MERNQAILTEFQRLTGFETEDSIQILESNDWDLRRAISFIHTGRAPPPSTTSSSNADVEEGTSTMASSESNRGGWLAFGYNVVATVARYGYTAITSSFSGASYILAIFFGTNQAPTNRRITAAALSFEQEYPNHPQIFQGSFQAALSEALDRGRFLLVYCHSSLHQNTASFLRSTLCTRHVADFIDDNYLFWLADVETPDGSRLYEALRGTTFPLLAVLSKSFQDPSRSVVLWHASGNLSADQLILGLTSVLESQGVLLETMRLQREERETNRRLMEEQDAAYRESLEQDRIKEALEAEKRRQAEEEARQVELAKQAEEQAQLSLQRELERKKAALPEEPPADAPNAVCLGFQLRDGTRLMRRFRLDSPMQIVYDYVDTHQAQFKSGSYVLVANYPRRTYRDTSITIADSGIHTDEVLFLSEL